MSCLPQAGGGCEKPFTDAFAAYLNYAEGTRYIHESCLDIRDGRDPQPDSQPEALYLDLERNVQLVIERKSICWPTDHFHRHSNDHFVSALFGQGLKSLAIEGAYEIGLPMLMKGTQRDLRLFVDAAVQSIQADWPRVVTGATVRGERNGEHWWSCRKVRTKQPWGWQFNFTGQASSVLDCVDASDLPEGIALDLKKLYLSCQRKFALYPTARRVLVLEPYEDLRYRGADWWNEVFSSFPPPNEIGEVWSGIFDYVTDELKDWVFEKLK
jgi:hypothetical protein